MRSFLSLICFCIFTACAGTPAPIYAPPPVYGLPGDPGNPAQGPFQPNAELFGCPWNISNPPPFDGDKRVTNFNPIIVVSGKVVMASVPVNDVCLSSGFGPRRGRAHNGSDYAPRPRGEERVIYTAAPGIVREARTASGFGSYVVIDHGHGVYTRYAHLASMEPWVQVGVEIGFGHALGIMGATGNASGVHLHFEVLTGDINNPRASFGLNAFDPLSFPPWAGLANNS